VRAKAKNPRRSHTKTQRPMEKIEEGPLDDTREEGKSNHLGKARDNLQDGTKGRGLH